MGASTRGIISTVFLFYFCLFCSISMPLEINVPAMKEETHKMQTDRFIKHQQKINNQTSD